MINKNVIPLEEKFRILALLSHDLIESRIFHHRDLSSNQFMILKILNAAGEKSVHEIAEILKISRAAASKNINTLVLKKLISRSENQSDRRYYNIAISGKGARFIEDHDALYDDRIAGILSNFSESEKKTFHRMLDKFIYHSIVVEENLSLFCMQCGGKYEGNCMISTIKEKCFFNVHEDNNPVHQIR
jgi:DNA-binding MarR family transcriptional regulator